MKEEIDKKIKAYYESKSLSKKQLDKIVAAQQPAKPNSWKGLLKYAAVFCFCLLGILLYLNHSSTKDALLEKYAQEVAFNHLKDLESDILTPKLSDLNDKMNKLNFEIYLPEKINRQYALLGGRYCSIDQRMAAQLKLKEKDTDKVVTLYVLDQLKNERYDESFTIDSTAIQIWNEKSNLFVLASNMPK